MKAGVAVLHRWFQDSSCCGFDSIVVEIMIKSQDRTTRAYAHLARDGLVAGRLMFPLKPKIHVTQFRKDQFHGSNTSSSTIRVQCHEFCLGNSRIGAMGPAGQSMSCN